MQHFGRHGLKPFFKSHSAHPHLRRSTRYLLIALLPLLLCWFLILNQSKEWAMTLTEQTAETQLEKNCMLIEQRLDSLYQGLSAVASSSEVNELIISSFEEDPPAFRTLSENTEAIISQYFMDFDSVCALYIVCPTFSDCFYNAESLPNYITLENILYYETLSQNPGAIMWFPTTRYDNVIRINDRYSKYYSDCEVFSLAVQMNLNYVKYRYLHKYDGTETPPVILLNIYSSIFDQWLVPNETTS